MSRKKNFSPKDKCLSRFRHQWDKNKLYDIHKAIFELLFLQCLNTSQSHLTKSLVRIFFFQKKINTNGDLAKVNNESNGAKVTVVVDYEPQKNSSQSHTLRQSDNVKIL